MADAQTGRAQRRTALMSVAAAVFLIALKLGTALASNSLALLAEAAHSGTDLIAALLTLFAVRLSVRGPDKWHHYGHGKAEHLAALAESTVLVAVSGFVGIQAARRLLGDGEHEVNAEWWTFAVLGLVIAIDASRAIVSQRAARRYRSAALASNALHFASDLAGSLAVLAGFVLVVAGEPKGDAAAALLVALLVVGAAGRLAHQSVDVLMDRASREADTAIRRSLANLQEGVEVRRVRVRHAAGRDFVDMVVAVRADAGLAQAHTTADAIEDAVRRELPDADVLVHVEPATTAGDLRERATVAALAAPEIREVHNVRVVHYDGGYELSLHVKLPHDMPLAAAHEIVERVERDIRAAVPELRRIHTHIEPLSRTDWAQRPPADEVQEAKRVIEETVERFTGAAPLDVRFRDAERGRIALVSVLLPADQPLITAHRRAGSIEETVRESCPEITDVIVHTEPQPAHGEGEVSPTG